MVKQDVGSVGFHPQLGLNGASNGWMDGWCVGGCWFTLTDMEERDAEFIWSVDLVPRFGGIVTI
jgi:hypothetical protein